MCIHRSVDSLGRQRLKRRRSRSRSPANSDSNGDRSDSSSRRRRRRRRRRRQRHSSSSGTKKRPSDMDGSDDDDDEEMDELEKALGWRGAMARASRSPSLSSSHASSRHGGGGSGDGRERGWSSASSSGGGSLSSDRVSVFRGGVRHDFTHSYMTVVWQPSRRYSVIFRMLSACFASGFGMERTCIKRPPGASNYLSRWYTVWYALPCEVFMAVKTFKSPALSTKYGSNSFADCRPVPVPAHNDSARRHRRSQQCIFYSPRSHIYR